MQIKVDTYKLEKTFIAHWTEFIDIREIRNFCLNIIDNFCNINKPYNIKQLSISRFENENNNFIVWVEVIVIQNSKQINITIECLLQSNHLIYKNYILNNI